MVLLIGLGNPGKKYQNNRHNVGHLFVDYLTSCLPLITSHFKLIKTDCFMNESGKFVKKLTYHLSLTTNHLIVIHDDLDIPLGKFHIQKGIGPRLHNGLESIEQNIKSKDFWRIRIGIDARPPTRWTNGETYVLQDFLISETNKLQNGIFPKILTQLRVFLKTEFSLVLPDMQL